MVTKKGQNKKSMTNKSVYHHKWDHHYKIHFVEDASWGSKKTIIGKLAFDHQKEACTKNDEKKNFSLSKLKDSL